MKYIISYRELVTIVEAETLLEAQTRVADDLYNYEKKIVKNLKKSEIMLNLIAREATPTDELWYNRKLRED